MSMARAELLEGASAAFRDEPGKTLADFLRAVIPASDQAKWSNEV
jgi:hypothetical protein